MPKHSTYADLEYRLSQATITRDAWQRGVYNFKKALLEIRPCNNPACNKSFEIKPYEPNKFCSRHCAAIVNNANRIVSVEARERISLGLKRYIALYHAQISKNLEKGRKHVALIELHCPYCKKAFYRLPYIAKRQKYCSNQCSMKVVGGRTTSPKASKGKSGIRLDIDPTICFYSTWEANISRVYNLVRLDWQYAPKIFDLGEHTYRPDFYLPMFDTYVEVKNFMGEYSTNRDRLFRERFPQISLEIISKTEYKLIEADYRELIENWE